VNWCTGDLFKDVGKNEDKNVKINTGLSDDLFNGSKLKRR
jgi:hypothetical protein